MALSVRKLKKALLLLCILLFLIDLEDDGRIGPTKSRIGWGHRIRKQTESLSHAIRPLFPKTKITSMLCMNTPIAAFQIIIQETRNSLNFTQNSHLQGGSSGGVPL